MLYLLSLYECWNLTKKIEQNREAGKEKGPSHSKWPSPRSLLEPTAQGFSHPHWDRQKKPERDPKTVSMWFRNLPSHGPEIFLWPETLKHLGSISRGISIPSWEDTLVLSSPTKILRSLHLRINLHHHRQQQQGPVRR